jgi:predicted MFS family arabinose efflux permease
MCFIRPQPAEPQATAGNARTLLRNRVVRQYLLYIFLLFFAVDVGQILAPKFLEEVRGLDIAQIGWLGATGAMGVLILGPLLSRLDRGSRLALSLGQMLALVSLALLAWAPGFPFLFFAFFIGGGNRLVRPLTLARFANLLTPATMSFGLGLQQTASQIGLALAPYAAGILYAHSPAWPLYAGFIALAVTLMLTSLLPARRPPDSAAVSVVTVPPNAD